MTISVILPVYNTEKYIEKCIQSIISSKLNDYIKEIIIVNDGSTDNSEQIIISKFNEKKIKLISQKNEGLCKARNTGIKQASGDYLWFIDSDDYINANDLKIITALETNPDMLFFNYKTVLEDGFSEVRSLKMRDNWIENKSFKGDVFHSKFSRGSAYVWAYLIRTDFIRNNELTFYSNIRYEDIEFTTKALFLAKKVLYVNVVMYYYLQRKGSILGSVKPQYFHYDHLKIAESFQNFYQKNQIDSSFVQEIKISILRAFLDISYYKKRDVALFKTKYSNNFKINYTLFNLRDKSLLFITKQFPSFIIFLIKLKRKL